MKKLFFALFLCTFTFLTTYAQENRILEKINFDTLSSFQNLIEKAERENKFIFIDVYADWCKPCKEMDKYVFNDSLVASMYNRNFLNIKINGENQIGKEFVEKYKITGYPSLLFFDNKANLLYHHEEYMNALLLYNVGMQILKKEDVNEKMIQLKNEVFEDIHKKYNDYPCEIENIQSYINSISEEKLEIELSEIANRYTKCIAENNLYSKEYLLFLLGNFINTRSDTAYTFYENNRMEFKKNYGDSLIVLESNIFFYSFFESVDKIQQGINSKQIIESKDINEFEREVQILLNFAERQEKESLEKKFQSTPVARFYNVILHNSTRFYGNNKNKEMYYKYVVDYNQPLYLKKYINYYGNDSIPMLILREKTSYYLQNFYSDNENIEELANIWNYVLNEAYQKTYNDYFISAKVFYYNKEKQQAKKMLEKAFELKDESFDEKVYEKLEEQINQM